MRRWFSRVDRDHVQEIVAVEITDAASGQSIGWVTADVAAALVRGEVDPAHVRALAERQTTPPPGSTRSPAGLAVHGFLQED